MDMYMYSIYEIANEVAILFLPRADVKHPLISNMHIFFVGDASNSSLASKPRLCELDRITGNHDKTVKVINRAASVWEKVAIRLHFEGYDILTIRKNEHQARKDACHTMFIEWLEGKGRTSTTWETVIKALEEAELAEVAKVLKDIFTT